MKNENYTQNRCGEFEVARGMVNYKLRKRLALFNVRCWWHDTEDATDFRNDGTGLVSCE
jgi:hypothetical protein